MKVVGVRHQTGIYEKKPYDNYYIYGVGVQNDSEDSQYYGVCPQMVKIKASILHEVVAPDKVMKLIDREVNFFYDSFKNVAMVHVENK